MPMMQALVATAVGEPADVLRLETRPVPGIVDALGEGVEEIAVGQRAITVGVTGTWQQCVVADAARVLPVPDELSASTAAQMLTNPLTAVLLVTRELDVQPGQSLLQKSAPTSRGRSRPGARWSSTARCHRTVTPIPTG